LIIIKPQYQDKPKYTEGRLRLLEDKLVFKDDVKGEPPLVSLSTRIDRLRNCHIEMQAKPCMETVQEI
jgi:hypothetical protein